RAVRTVAEVVGRLVEPEGNGRRIVPALWPDTGTVDHGLRSGGAEFDGIGFVELETYRGAVEERKFIDVVSAVMDARMAADDRVVVLGEDIHRLRGGTNGAEPCRADHRTGGRADLGPTLLTTS
ncbi:MAG: hypothetical protein RLP10_01230, partial [Roseibium album]